MCSTSRLECPGTFIALRTLFDHSFDTQEKPIHFCFTFLRENQQTHQYVQVFSSPAQFQQSNGTTKHNVVFTNIQPSKVTGAIQLLRKH